MGVKLHNQNGEHVDIAYEPATNRYFIDRHQAGPTDFSDKFASVDYAPRQIDDDVVELVLYVDVASVEVFADGGRTVMTDIFFPSQAYDRVSLFAEDAQVEWQMAEGVILGSIWR